MLNKNNKFRPFAENALDIYSDETYDGLQARKDGNLEKTRADAKLNNTALKQSSIMTTAWAELISQANPEATIDSSLTPEEIVDLLKKTITTSTTDGDMKKSVFAKLDPSGGFVDKSKNSEKLNNQPSTYWASKDDVNNAIGQINALLDDINGEVI